MVIVTQGLRQRLSHHWEMITGQYTLNSCLVILRIYMKTSKRHVISPIVEYRIVIALGKYNECVVLTYTLLNLWAVFVLLYLNIYCYVFIILG